MPPQGTPDNKLGAVVERTTAQAFQQCPGEPIDRVPQVPSVNTLSN